MGGILRRDVGLSFTKMQKWGFTLRKITPAFKEEIIRFKNIRKALKMGMLAKIKKVEQGLNNG